MARLPRLGYWPRDDSVKVMLEKIKNSKLFQNSKFNLQNLLEGGFYLFIFLLPWQTHLIIRPGEWHGKFGGNWPVDYWQIVLYGTDILLLALLLLALAFKLKKKKEDVKMDKKSLPWVFLGLLDLALFISIAFAPDKALAIYKYAVFLFGLGLFWLSSQNFYNKTKAVTALSLAAALQGILAIGQFFTQGSAASKWLGMASHTAVDPGASVIETLGSDGRLERWLRAYGSLDHPNMLGGFLAICLIFLFQVILNYQRKGDGKTDFRFIVYSSLFVVSSLGLLLTFSRSAILAVLVGLVLLFIQAIWKKDKMKIIRSLKVGVFAAVLSAVCLFSYSNVFFTRTSSDARLEVKSLAERQMYWNDSWSLIKDGHWLGTGIGNYTIKLAEKEPARIFWQYQPVHNVFVLSLAEVGMAGLLFFISFLAVVLFLSLRRKNLFNLSVLLSLGIIMILDHYLWSLHFGAMLFWLTAGLLIRNFEDNKEYVNQGAQKIST